MSTRAGESRSGPERLLERRGGLPARRAFGWRFAPGAATRHATAHCSAQDELRVAWVAPRDTCFVVTAVLSSDRRDASEIVRLGWA